ncbi:MAG: helix-turn-helix transcriptional regulator [Nocardioides sp.]|uniref:helix-turn-helix domain-containing protein n=1 Tax=Nocardioides sp. TaxID=35761 RepID=UPI0039E388BE
MTSHLLAETREAVAAEIRAAMARKRLTRGELAQRLGVARTTLADRLDANRPFDTDMLAAICGELEIDLLSLFPVSASAVESA